MNLVMFKDVKRLQQFIYQDKEYIKVQYKKASCCTPEHNAMTRNRRTYILLQPNDEVYVK